MATLYVEDGYIVPDLPPYFDLLDGARVVVHEARIPLIVQDTAKRVAQ